MGNSLKPGLVFEFKYKVPENKTVPYVYPDLPTGEDMPKVFATGFMVGLIEHTCIQVINPHIDWPREQSVGTKINVSHIAATPPGFTVTVKVKLEKVEGRRLSFSVEAHDGVDKISEGTHERYIIKAEKFGKALAEKAAISVNK
ncbi:MAG: thioesterase family protein [Deltaproteobacteria bacterium]|nr:thioesterase family protein [Deltaproteobacteria bacterium]